MRKNLTLLEKYYLKKRVIRVVTTTLIVFGALSLVYGFYVSHKHSESIPEQQVAGVSESEEANTSNATIPSMDTEMQEQDTPNPPEEASKQSIESNLKKTQTIEPPEQEPSPNTNVPENVEIVCTEDDINQYNTAISNLKKAITTEQTYLDNPSCKYPYTASACTMAYDNCVTNVNNWYNADGTCSRLPRSGACATLNSQKITKLSVCQQEKDSCNSSCDSYIILTSIEYSAAISQQQTSIKQYEQKLSDCNK